MSCEDDPVPTIRGPEYLGPFGPGITVTSTEEIKGLTDRVDVIRDKYGMVHIYAQNATDAYRAQGYALARDRMMQVEIIRRLATGRLAEVGGDLEQDVTFRVAGLARAGKAMYEGLAADSDIKKWVDAYADGISQWNERIRNSEVDLPEGVFAFTRDLFTPFTGADVFAIARLQAYNLSYTADSDIRATEFTSRVQETFRADATRAANVKRAGFLQDVYRFAPIDPTLIMDGFPSDPGHSMLVRPAVAKKGASPKVEMRTVRLAPELMKQVSGFLTGVARARTLLGEKEFTGSNNWVVSPSRTATGHAMLASDPHLIMSAPPVFWMTHMQVATGVEANDFDFAGISFPGIPAVIIGFNKDVAWAATTADYDVTDVYKETLAPGGAGVVFEGRTVPFETSRETVNVQGKIVEYDQKYVPHHGPVVPTVADGAVTFPTTGDVLSIKWTGHVATTDINAVMGFVRAKDVEDIRTSLREFEVGAQNWVAADSAGNIFYSSQSQIPKRDLRAFTWNADTYTGTMPAFVLPGDGTAEWKGFVEEAYVPHLKNPSTGYIATANGDQVGVTLDNDPTNDLLPNGEKTYIGAFHDVGFRTGRVNERIKSVGHPMTLEDMADIQSDKRSNVGMRLAPLVVTTLSRAEAEKRTPGTHPDLTALVTSPRYDATLVASVKDTLTRWGSESKYDAPSGVDPTTNLPAGEAPEVLASRATLVFNAWLVRMIGLTFDDELLAISADAEKFEPPYTMQRALMNLMLPDKTTLKTYDAAYGDSIVFDDIATPALESRDERILLSMLDALDLVKTRRGADQNGWRWGLEHTIRFNSLVSLWGQLSIPAAGDLTFPKGFPRGGDGFNVDVAGYNARPENYADVNFAYAHGPTQRFVIDMDPAGPVARNALPGGNVWDFNSPYFKDDVELWRRNQNRRVNFAKEHVIEDAKARVQLVSTK